MKKPFPLYCLYCLSLFPFNFLFSQSVSICRDVLASGGGDAMVTDKKFEYTLGESVTATIGNGSRLFTQGFNQPEICPLTIGTTEIAEASGLTVFPNPTTGELFLRFEAPTGKTFQLQVFNAAAQLVSNLPKTDDSQASVVDCRAFPPGVYLLVALAADGSLFFQVPFVKADR